MAEVTLKPAGAQDAASVLMQVRRLITTNPASAFLMMMQRISFSHLLSHALDNCLFFVHVIVCLVIESNLKYFKIANFRFSNVLYRET